MRHLDLYEKRHSDKIHNRNVSFILLAKYFLSIFILIAAFTNNYKLICSSTNETCISYQNAIVEN